MQIIVSGQNLPMTEALKEYSTKKIGRLDKYFAEAIVDGKIELAHHQTKSPDKSNEARVKVMLHGAMLTAKEEHQDMYAAIDLLFEKLERQIKKYKDKIKNRKGEKIAVAIEEISKNDDEDFEKDTPIVYTVSQSLKPMFVDEAVLQLQINGKQDFLVFNNCEDGQLNVLYRRKDGDFGLIEPKH